MTSAIAVHPDTAVLGDVAGRAIVLRYGEVAAEYGALRTGAMLVDHSHRHRSRITGARAAETLAGLVTNDVKSLVVGQGQYAAALTPKGKIVADLRVLARPGNLFLLDTGRRAAEGWMSVLRKYVNPRSAPYADVSEELAVIGLYGPHARRLMAQHFAVSPEALAALAPYSQIDAELSGGPVMIVRAPDFGAEGYELWLAPNAADGLWRTLERAGATAAGQQAWEIVRIEAGRPEWGIEIDDTTIPQEANFDELHAISYTKGCYTGQETVARVHFRGHVNRHLRGLRYESAEPLPAKAQLFDADCKLVGDVRSAAISPRLGGIALGMVRREIDLDTSLRARLEGAEGAELVPVKVSALPL